MHQVSRRSNRATRSSSLANDSDCLLVGWDKLSALKPDHSHHPWPSSLVILLCQWLGLPLGCWVRQPPSYPLFAKSILIPTNPCKRAWHNIQPIHILLETVSFWLAPHQPGWQAFVHLPQKWRRHALSMGNSLQITLGRKGLRTGWRLIWFWMCICLWICECICSCISITLEWKELLTG